MSHLGRRIAGINPAVNARSASLVALLAALAACGGTTGRELLPTSAVHDGLDASGEGGDATTSGDDGGSNDATVQDNADFDVYIMYADRLLPDLGAPPPTAAADAGEAGVSYPWPNCPPFLPVRGREVVPLGMEQDQVPSDYGPDGGLVLAPDGSACASYGWLGSPAADDCEAMTVNVLDDFPQLPPCNWCVDAGFAVQGPNAGQSRYSVCLALYSCMVQSGCGANPVTCICGTESTMTCIKDPNPPGPCATLEMGSLEERPGSVEDALMNYTGVNATFLGVCGSRLNNVFYNASTGLCFPDGGP